ncbi:hypothetical protein [Streptomyces sp. V4I2]|uniref:hypothetical protein n=1 Tax=Streptomyces sp. V4I2 TaxID=3042280 RepID=UPI0027879349|nr:hypothetical protein [Streptomyces sp. V4I2]MDQ1051188.1 hypothetical protein [Streptomyces sp. V4I2]
MEWSWNLLADDARAALHTLSRRAEAGEDAEAVGRFPAWARDFSAHRVHAP